MCIFRIASGSWNNLRFHLTMTTVRKKKTIKDKKNMVKIELDINGISFFVSTTWKTDAVPAVGDIVIVDKESISQFDRAELRKTPSNQTFKWADEEDDSPALNHFDFDTEMVVKKLTWKFDTEDEEMVCVLKVTFLHHEE